MDFVSAKLTRKISIAPLVVYRMLFGLMAFYGGIWSIMKEDPQTRYLEPTFFFKYYGLEWLEFAGAQGIYALYFIWVVSAIGIFFGAFYRLAIWSFFIAFTYLHALDATNYINHYYAISIFAALLGVLPANAAVAVDVWRNPTRRCSTIPYYYIGVFQVQIAIIYTFAGIAKLNSDWLLAAMPLKIWLLQKQDFPLIGSLFHYHTVPLVASWIGCLFDLTIVWWLWNVRTRKWAYGAVVCFHVMTGLLFNIGLFPMVMIFSTVVFFDANRQLAWLERWRMPISTEKETLKTKNYLGYLLGMHLTIQLLLPLRHHFLYSSNPIWSEEGYRFSWRVMLVEKEGMATFYVQDPKSERHWEVSNLDFLTPFQEKRMAVRPEHIRQFARHIAMIYAKRYEMEDPIVLADVFVAFNGRVSQRLIDPTVNLAKQEASILSNNWILPFVEN